MKAKLILSLLLILSLSLTSFLSMAKADNTNYANTTFWSYYGYSAGWSIGIPTAPNMDRIVTFDGKSVIEMDHDTYYLTTGNGGPYGTRELDGAYTYVHLGDHVVYSAYIWTATSAIGSDPGWGGMFGLDLYCSGGRLCELSTPDGRPTAPNYPASRAENIVSWGSNSWVYVSMDFTVGANPNSYPEINGANGQYRADGFGGPHSGGTFDTPTAFIPWIAGDSSNPNGQTAKIYVYDTQLYINPGSLSPTPSPTPAPTPTPTPSSSPFPTATPTPAPTATPFQGANHDPNLPLWQDTTSSTSYDSTPNSNNLPLMTAVAIGFTLPALFTLVLFRVTSKKGGKK